jgi:phospholipase C
VRISRRGFLVLSAALALDACSSSSHASRPRPTSSSAGPGGPSTTTTTLPRVAVRRAGERPDPTRAEGTKLIGEIEHVVVVMQENHSYDSYFGMLGRGDGFTLDAAGNPTAANRGADGTLVHAFHEPSTCQPHSVSQNWNAMHVQWSNGAMDGFVRSDSGRAAMGYWTERDIPFYYSLARTFPVCDRWFAPTFGQTFPNRRFLMCASALGTTSTSLTDMPVRPPAQGTLVEMLNRNHISWRDYHHDLASVLLFPDDYNANVDKCPPLEQFFHDAGRGALPAFSLVEPNSLTTTEENPQDLSLGEAFVASVVDAVMKSPAWPKTVLVFCYDEHGGYYDHVPPPRAVAPDDIAPNVKPDQPAGDYTHYGFRVPAVVVSPYAKRGYVSHVVHDHTSILSLVEHVWNLPALSNRDGAADALLDCFDFASVPFATPPTLARPLNTTGQPRCAVVGS